MAISKDGGNTFEKLGPILSGKPVDPNWKGTAQGNANASVVVDHTGEWLYAYYTEHSRVDPATGKQRSVITCMARSKLSDGGKPGTWKKYFKGKFNEPGLGGRDTEVANVWAPQVTFIPQLNKYVMLGMRGGIGYLTSDDGINWSSPTALVVREDEFNVGYLEHYRSIAKSKPEKCGSPSLFLRGVSDGIVDGELLYCFGDPGYLVKRRIALKLTPVVERTADTLKSQLSDTQWLTNKGVVLNWSKSGVLKINGRSMKWSVENGNEVAVTIRDGVHYKARFNSGLNGIKINTDKGSQVGFRIPPASSDSAIDRWLDSD
jgi:hypothetical protein